MGQQFNPGEILTYAGHTVSPLEIEPDDIDILDIAHALSNLCRFTGHVSEFRSVAAHSVDCYDLAKTDKLWVLLHDASEAYINDIARPLKHTEAYAAYRVAEERIMKAVAVKFNLEWPEPDEVRRVDNIMLVTEMRDLMPGIDFASTTDMREEPIRSMTPKEAEKEFLMRFFESENDQSNEDFLADLEAQFSEWHVDEDEEDQHGGAGIVLTPIKPKPSFGDALPEPEEIKDLELVGS